MPVSEIFYSRYHWCSSKGDRRVSLRRRPSQLFPEPYFRKKLYLKKATEVTLRLLEEMKLGPEEEVEICRSFVFDETREELFRKFGKEKVKTAIISGEAQHNVETAYLDEIRNLGYEPLPDRDDKRAGSFFHMLRWVKNDRTRLKHAKTGWPRLKRYIHLRKHRLKQTLTSQGS